MAHPGAVHDKRLLAGTLGSLCPEGRSWDAGKADYVQIEPAKRHAVRLLPWVASDMGGASLARAV